MADETAVAKAEPKAQVAMDARGVNLQSLDEAARFCLMIHKSGLAPKSLGTPEKIMVALQAGMEAGLPPMKALQSVYVVNGMPSWMGKAALGLIRSSGVCEWMEGPAVDGEGDERAAAIRSKRKDQPSAYETRFSVADAKKAHLWGKSGPWTDYPDRMLGWRAVGFHGDDYYSDVLGGLTVSQAAEDHPHRDARRMVDVTPPPAEPDPLLKQIAEPDEEPEAPAPEPERDPATGEIIPDHVGRRQDELPIEGEQP